MNRTIKFILSTFAIIWLLSVIFLYFYRIDSITDSCPSSTTCIQLLGNTYEIQPRKSHQYYRDALFPSAGTPLAEKGQPLYGILFAIALIYVCIYAVVRFVKNKKELQISLSPLMIYLLFSIVFFITAFQWFSFSNLLEYPAPHTGIIGHYFFLSVSLLFLSLATITCGKYLLRFFNTSLPTMGMLYSLTAFGIGSASIILILFFLALFGQLTTTNVWILFILILGVGWKEVWHTLLTFFKRSYTFQSAFFGPSIWLLILVSIVASHNILELIRPMPMGFDDLGVYMNIPKLLATSGELISGTNSYPWGIFMSIGFLIFQSPTVAMGISFLGGILTYFALYYLISFYTAKRGIKTSFYALFGATLFYTLPATIFQSAKDMKVDLAAMFFAVTAVTLFWYWVKQYKEKKDHHLSFLFFSSLLLGMSFAIKYNFLILGITLFVYLLYTLITRRDTIRAFILTVLVFGITFCVSFAPFGFKNMIETNQLNPLAPGFLSALQTGKGEGPTISFVPPITIDNTAITQEAVQASGIREELQRYLGYDEGIMKYLKLPLTVTLNELTFGMYVDIGFIFLGFLPVFFLFLYWIGKEQEETYMIKEVAFFGALYWILWGALAQGVIWYGFAGFIFLILMLIEFLHFIKTYPVKIVSITFSTAIIFWFICIGFLRSAYLPNYAVVIDPVGLAYARGIVNEEGYLKQKIKVYLPIMEMINTDIAQNKENPPKIYRIGTFIKYFLARNNTTVLDDNQLDVFTSIYQDKDDQKTIQRLKNSGFKYIIVDTNTATIDKTPEKTLTQKYNTLLTFLQNNQEDIKIITYEPSFGILFAQIQ